MMIIVMMTGKKSQMIKHLKSQIIQHQKNYMIHHQKMIKKNLLIYQPCHPWKADDEEVKQEKEFKVLFPNKPLTRLSVL